MFLKTSLFFSRYSTTSLKWRNQLKHKKLVSQISSLLLQRKNWQSLIASSLPLTLTSLDFLQILHKTQNHPHLSLEFFNFATKSLSFNPDIRCQSKLIQLLLQSNLLEPANSLVKPLVKSVPAMELFDMLLRYSKGKNSEASNHGFVFDFLLECYSNHGSVTESLEILKTVSFSKWVPSPRSCNALFCAFWREDDVSCVRPCLSVVLRCGVMLDLSTWPVLARLLCKEGKLEQALVMLNSGNTSPEMYDLVIECYSKKGSFKVALDLVNEMGRKGFIPGFITYSSVLDGACRSGEFRIVDSIINEMVDRKLLSKSTLLDYDFLIRNFCEEGKSYAAEMFFRRAMGSNIGLGHSSYLRLLNAFCIEGRVNEATKLYRLILERNIKINVDGYKALVTVSCLEEPSEEVNFVLKDVIKRGYVPSASDISRYIGSLCTQSRFLEADTILNLGLDKGFVPHGFCGCSLVEYHCSSGCVDSAVALHDKIQKLGGTLDITSYNVLLNRLSSEKRIEEAIEVFDYMNSRNTVSSESFSIMITTLCCEKKMKQAMKAHDEMMKKGLKPDESTYKRLISGFA